MATKVQEVVPSKEPPNQKLVELLSSVYQRFEKKVNPTTLKQYAEFTAKLCSNPAQTDQTKSFIADYFATVAQIENDKEKLTDSGELIVTLSNLPERGEQTIKLHELVVKPDVFDGERPKPRKWIQEYNEAIVANGWSDKLAIKYLPTFLSKSAKDWYWTEIRPYVVDTLKWLHVAEQFSKNYLGDADLEQLSNAVDNTRQRPNEPVSNFIPRYRRLLLLLSPATTEVEQIRQLRTRLRPEYKPFLAISDPKTLKSLKEICLKIEAGLVVNKTSHQENNQKEQTQREGNRRASRDKESKRNPNMEKSSTTRTTTRSDSNRKSKSITCYTCDRVGHIAKECFAKTKKNGEEIDRKSISKQGGQQVNAISEVPEAAEILLIKHRHEEKASKSRSQANPINLVVGGGRLLEQSVNCNNVEVIAVIDTGAYVSVIDESLAIVNGWAIKSPVPPLIGAGGKLLQARGIVTLDFEIRLGMTTKKKSHSFAVVKNLTTQLLVGLELMRSFEILIDTANYKLNFKSKAKSGVRVREDVLLPSRSQVLVEAEINEVGLVLISPFHFQSGIQAANAVAEVKDRKLPMLLLNPNLTTSELKKRNSTREL